MPGSTKVVPAVPRSGRFSVAVMTLLLACGMVVAGHAPGAGAQTAGGIEGEFAARVTDERRAAGLGPLATEDDLVAVARRHSAEMAASGRLYHNTLLGQQVQNWLIVAENVGVGSSVDQVHQALMASPTHRADILDSRFTGIGVGVAQAGSTVWVTQVFRRSVPPAPTVSPPAPLPLRDDTVERPDPRSLAVRQAATPVPATTTTTAPVPVTTVPVTTTAPPPGDRDGDLDLDTLAVSSVPNAPATDLVAIGLLAAVLLWAVAAGAVQVAVRSRIR